MCRCARNIPLKTGVLLYQITRVPREELAENRMWLVKLIKIFLIKSHLPGESGEKRVKKLRCDKAHILKQRRKKKLNF